jgi:NADH-quinone oxidoreductase subunit M
MLLALIMIYRFIGVGSESFDMVALRVLVEKSASVEWLRFLFVMLFIAFAVKIPIVPLHVWLLDAHVEAPTPVSVILAGILLKLGGYGLFRICYPLFPTTAMYFGPLMIFIGMFGIVYGAFCALAQKDMKKLVAYSSVSHMGFVLLGLGAGNAAGVSGAMFQMISHGLITAMMFLLVGFIYERAHHREITGFGGLASVMPKYFGLALFTFFAALGLPALSGFVAEMLILVGAFTVSPVMTAIASFGVVITVGYCLWLIRRVFMGPLNSQYAKLKDLDARELTIMVPLVVLVLWLGVYPQALLNVLNVALSGMFH